MVSACKVSSFASGCLSLPHTNFSTGTRSAHRKSVFKSPAASFALHTLFPERTARTPRPKKYGSRYQQAIASNTAAPIRMISRPAFLLALPLMAEPSKENDSPSSMPAAAHPMIFPVSPNFPPRSSIRISPPYKVAIQGMKPFTHMTAACFVCPFAERIAKKANIEAQTTQSKSARKTAPVLNDSFVMHNSIVFIKSGKMLSAASAPKSHFAEALIYASLKYSPIFFIGASSDSILFILNLSFFQTQIRNQDFRPFITISFSRY